MKKIIAVTSALAAASCLTMAEIRINEFLSFEGFVDMSYSHSDADINSPDGSESESDNSFGIDQVEIDWLFNFGKLTAQVDLEYEESGDDTEVEQAFVSYDLGNGSAVTVGRYESMLGLEAKEPTGLYQYSNAYSIISELADGSPLPQYAQGVKFTKTTDTSFLGLSIQDQAFGTGVGSLGGSGGDTAPDGTYAIEAAASITSGDTTYFIGSVYEDGDDFSEVWFLNGHVSHQTGLWTLGAEVFIGNTELDFGFGGGAGPGPPNVDLDLTGGLIMANYAYNECSSVTARVSYVQYDVNLPAGLGGISNLDVEGLKYTLAHNYALTDNLAIITEISYSDFDISGSGGGEESGSIDGDELLGAVEVLFTF
ncbi:MAG: porin [Opitutae bacterium]|nr:porin [Opitutae bacterium]MDG1301381.1 porin [Opitutae bacterium]